MINLAITNEELAVLCDEESESMTPDAVIDAITNIMKNEKPEDVANTNNMGKILFISHKMYMFGFMKALLFFNDAIKKSCEELEKEEQNATKER